jgi:sialic acid synthase SpsE
LYKVASFDVVNHKLLRHIAETGKTVIMSVGMANLNEIKSAYEILKDKTEKITILHCVSAYPTQEKDANLAVINSLQKEFECVIGQSDHTNDIQVPLYAATMGAQVLEKHYKINSAMDCVDSSVSITEKQFKKLIEELQRIESIMGSKKMGIFDVEEEALQFRRQNA